MKMRMKMVFLINLRMRCQSNLKVKTKMILRMYLKMWEYPKNILSHPQRRNHLQKLILRRKLQSQNKSCLPSKRTPKKSSSTHPKDDDNDGSPKVFSRKKEDNKGGKQKISTLTKSSLKEKTEKVSKGKGKNKEKLNPSDDQLRDAICEILKEVDPNMATFTDILRQLAKQFDMDLTPRKQSVKLMIQEELTKLADEADDEDDEGDAKKDERQCTGEEVVT